MSSYPARTFSAWYNQYMSDESIHYSDDGSDPFDALMRAEFSSVYREYAHSNIEPSDTDGSEFFAFEDVKPGIMYSHALVAMREAGFFWVGRTMHVDTLRDTDIAENWFWSTDGILTVVRGDSRQNFVNICLFFNVKPHVPAVFNELNLSGHYERTAGPSEETEEIFIGDVLLVSGMRDTLRVIRENGTLVSSNWCSLPLPLRYALGHEYLSDKERRIFGERPEKTPDAVLYINRHVLNLIGVDYERRRPYGDDPLL